MLMSIRPGWSRPGPQPRVYPRLEAVRGEVDRRGLDVDVEIDGGVKIDNARAGDRCRRDRAVAASAIFQAAGPRGRRARGSRRSRWGGGLDAETILVVDDDPDIARFVEVNLRSAGYDVAVAADGEEALEKAGELRPDLVLLDVMMPRIDGFEVAQRLRKNPQTANTSIIMLTAKALSADKVTGLQSGRRRLHHQAVRPDRAARAGQGHAPPREGDAEPLAAHGAARATSGSRRRSSGRFARTRPFAVLYCDLDNFKTYNDQKGFVRGDRLIQATARIIQDAVVEFDGGRGVRRPRRRRRLRGGRAPRRRRAGRQAHLRAVRRGAVGASTSRRTSSAASSGWRTARACMQDIPLVAISVGIATTADAPFAHYGEAVAVATEMKQFAKRDGRLLLRRRPPRSLSRRARRSSWRRPADVPPVYSRRDSSFPGRGAIPHRR